MEMQSFMRLSVTVLPRKQTKGLSIGKLGFFAIFLDKEFSNCVCVLPLELLLYKESYFTFSE